jgi:anionic cell wall polymer biosynthesis LytR-Cps2A-Psr (LCP) family protein
MQALEQIIDTVGGVDLYLPYNVDGKSTDPEDPFDLGFFQAGNHHFDGETAVRFARIRMMDNDYNRTTRQSMVLKALWEKVITPEILPQLPQMITILSGSVQMNFQASDIRPLVCLAPLLDEQSLTFANIPLEMLDESRIYLSSVQNTTFVYKVDQAEFRALIQDFQQGRWPTPAP